MTFFLEIDLCSSDLVTPMLIAQTLEEAVSPANVTSTIPEMDLPAQVCSFYFDLIVMKMYLS